MKILIERQASRTYGLTNNLVRSKLIIAAMCLAVITVSSYATSKSVAAGINPSLDQTAGFNRRFIRINDYLFNGNEDTTAVAHIDHTRNNIPS